MGRGPVWDRWEGPGAGWFKAGAAGGDMERREEGRWSGGGG